ncbi:MAG: hypothetical protein JW900_07865 [Anaerolineae bacterium]|nr:hypothetical protein [Anaerolineae bacterium]
MAARLPQIAQVSEGNPIETHSTRRPWLQVALALLALLTFLLVICLVTLLVTNAATAIWGWQSHRSLQREQERATTLESELQRLRQLLEQEGIEVPLSPADAQLIDQVEQQVAELRQLPPREPVERTLISHAELYELLVQEFAEEFSPAEAHDNVLALAAFELLDRDMDLYDFLLQLQTEQIAGFYDAETRQIYVITDLGVMGQFERLLYAHEFTHALQDQHFDLQQLGIRRDADEQYDSEYLIAVRSLIEGDASLLEQQFLETYYSLDDMQALMQEVRRVETPLFDAAPDVLREQMMFPYEYGLVFVEALYDQGGWEAVGAAYANPPLSTEHILHPERYRAGDAPQVVALPPLTGTLGADWRQVEEDIMGEYFLRYYLAQRISTSEAVLAAEGWGGDRYAVYSHQGDEALLLALYTTWDTPADGEEFVDAYVNFAQDRFGTAGEMGGGGRICWQGAADALCLSWGAVDAAVVLGPEQLLVETVLSVIRDD